MNEPVAPPLRSRVPTTAGPWQLVGRFDASGGDVEPGPISAPEDIGGVATWLQRFDERLVQLAGPSPTAGPAAIRRLGLGGRRMVPSLPAPAVLRVDVADVRPNQPFLLAAMEEQDEPVPGARVGDGTFEINRVTIPVSGFDSLEEVLDRIERSGAGVSARFDPSNGQIRVASAARGAQARIAFGHDTSAFLNEFRLDRTPVEPGRDPGFDGPLGGLGGLGGVIAGTIVVNGVTVTMDPAVDSLEVVLGRLTARTDAIAGFDTSSRRVVLGVGLPPGSLEIDDSTGLFDGLGLSSGVYTSAAGRLSDPALVIRSWVGPGDRVERRVPDQWDRYHRAGARSYADPSPPRRRTEGDRTISDRLAGMPTPLGGPPNGAAPNGSADEEIRIRRQLMG